MRKFQIFSRRMVFHIAPRQCHPNTKRIDDKYNEEAFCYESERF